MKLKTAKLISDLITVCIVLTAVIGFFSGGSALKPLFGVEVFLLIVSTVFNLKFLRCPHCGGYVGRIHEGQCRLCGKEIKPKKNTGRDA